MTSPLSFPISPGTIRSYENWSTEMLAYEKRACKWTQQYRKRRSQQEAHPVFDFLFTYYDYSLRKFETWHPQLGDTLEKPTHFSDQNLQQFDSRFYKIDSEAIFLDSSLISKKQNDLHQKILTILENTQKNSAYFGCFGLHEWAMVYRAKEVRHEKSVQLRLSQQEIDHVVESRPIVCSHFDAFRFFPLEARSFNKLQPDKKEKYHFEQPGCIHANMDLYKWAYRCMPWIGSTLLEECFQLALDAREIDMRASPYDLRPYGYTPIPVEQTEGRTEYEQEQRRLAEKGRKLRKKLIDFLYAIKT